MKKVIFILMLGLFASAQAMDKYPTNDEQQQFKTAIITGDKKAVETAIMAGINTCVWLDDNGITCLSLALANNIDIATLIVATVKARIQTLEECKNKEGYDKKECEDEIIRNLEGCLLCPFQAIGDHVKEIGKSGSPGELKRLMQLDIPHAIKQRGCRSAFGGAYQSYKFYTVELLCTEYHEYITNPCSNFGFQWGALCFPDKYKGITDLVLMHPKAIDDLQNMITSNNLVYPERKEQYLELLERAKMLQNKSAQE